MAFPQTVNSAKNLLCIACDSPDVKPHQDILDFSLFKCKSCGLVFQRGDKQTAYEINYYDSWFEEDSETVWNMKEKTFSKYVAEILAQMPGSGQYSLLDIGCAFGALLASAGKANINAVGIEISQAADVAVRRGYNVYRQPLADCEFHAGSFDIVTAVDLIEHISNPNIFFAEINRIMKKEGILFLVTPDVSSCAAKIMRKNWPHFKSEHLIYYSPRSIKKMLERHGFGVVKTKKAFKYLTLWYIIGHFKKFSNGLILQALNKLSKIIPGRLMHKPLYLKTEMMVIAKKQ